MPRTEIMQPKGFTLVELLITMSIFSILLMVVIAIFLQAQRAQRQAASLQQLQADGRYVLTKISNEFQNNGSIDFDYELYTQPGRRNTLNTVGVDRLAIVLNDGTKHVYGLNTSFPNSPSCGFRINDIEDPSCLMMQEKNIEDQQLSDPVRVSATGIIVEKVKFYLSPNKNPFVDDPATGMYDSDIQPHITISLSEKSYIRGQKEPAIVNLQTTLTSREYRR